MGRSRHPVVPVPPARRAWVLPLLAASLALLAVDCGGGGGGGGAATTPAAPRIQSFTPDAGHAGSTQVTLQGTGFTGFTAVAFGTVPATSAKGESDTAITVVVPAGAATGTITVTTPAGTHTSVGTFTVRPAPEPLPEVTGFDPVQGFPGQSVVLTGSGFAGAVGVTFGGAAAQEFWPDGDTRIRAVLPPTAVTGPVGVETPAGLRSSPTSFTVLAAPVPPRTAPTVSDFTPRQGPPGTRVALAGTHLATVSKVSFNGVPGELELQDDQNLVATVPPGAGTGPIQVVAPAGSGTSDLPFTVTAPPARGVTGLSTLTGPPGTYVTITGADFAGATAVTFGRVAALYREVVDDGTIRTQVPQGAVTGPVEVHTPSRRYASPMVFTVEGGPADPSLAIALTRCEPIRATPGTLVLITGTGLRKVTDVYFGEVRATDVRINNDTSMRVRVPLMASSGLIFADGGGGSSSWGPFTVDGFPDGPVITDFSPAAGPLGTLVILTGTGFTGANEVIFGEYGTQDLTVSPDGTRITVAVPARAVTGKLGVSTPNGFRISPNVFTVVPPAPPLATGFSPSSGQVGDRVTVTGANLDAVREVGFTPAQAGATVAGQVVAAQPDGTAVTVEVPEGAASGPLSLDYGGPRVEVPGGDFALVQLRPRITAYSPREGIAGTEVTLTGRGLAPFPRVAFNGATLDANRVRPVSDQEVRVRIPDDSEPGTQGTLAVTTDFGTAGTDGPFTVLASRESELDRTLARTPFAPAGVTLLDAPGPLRAAPYALQVPQAPVFHPLLLQADPRSNPGGPAPSFILNLKLAPVFYPALPGDVRRQAEALGLKPADVDLRVVAQHNVWAPGRPAGYLPDYYEFKPQYWVYPDTPLAGARSVSSLLETFLFPEGAAGLAWSVYGLGLVDEPGFGFSPSGAGGAMQVAGRRLLLEGFDPARSWGFYTMAVLNKRAVVTLHLLLNDGDQRILADAAADGSLDTSAKVFEYLGRRGFSQRGQLAALARPLVLAAQVTRRPLPAMGVDEILIRGDLFRDDPDAPGPLTVRVSGPGGPVALEPGQVTILGATLVRLLVPTGTAVGPASVANRLGTSDVFEIP